MTGPGHFRAAERPLDDAALMLDTDVAAEDRAELVQRQAAIASMATGHGLLAARRSDRAQRPSGHGRHAGLEGHSRYAGRRPGTLACCAPQRLCHSGSTQNWPGPLLTCNELARRRIRTRMDPGTVMPQRVASRRGGTVLTGVFPA
jgi:hypothetical protein